MNDDDLRLLTLHGLRLAGLATVAAVAEIHGLESASVEAELERLRNIALVTPARGGADRWTLTTAGRRHGEQLLARQLDASTTPTGEPGRPVVADVYRRFLDLNRRMLDVCTRWQIVDNEPLILNDHSDAMYDAAIIDEVAEIDGRIQPMCGELEAVSARFGRYAPGFTEALRRLRRGEADWLTKPTIASYHTRWFQLHEDLLATLGLDRAAETARSNGDPTPEPPEPTDTARHARHTPTQ